MRMAVLHVIGASLLLPAAAVQHVIEWHDLYDAGSEPHEEHYTVGDSVMFRWMGSENHNLMNVSKSAYTNCVENGAMLNDGRSTGQIEQVVDFPKTGEFYFLCSVGSHCNKNQKINITIDPDTTCNSAKMMYPSKDAAEAKGSMCDPPVNGSHKMGSCWILGDSHGACGGMKHDMPSPPPPAAPGDDDAPCFARGSTTACRVTRGTSAAEAFPQCFGDAPSTTAEAVLMSSLTAGDLVLASPASVTRVLLNQHVPSKSTSHFVTLHFGGGELALTPDHVLELDGEWAPAREAKAGSRLSNGRTVERVTDARSGIINPLTASGTILANGVVASVYPEWISTHMLSSKLYPLPLSACNLLTYLFPAPAQTFYDAAIEPLFDGGRATYRKYLEVVPPALVTPAIAALDGLIAAAFVLPPALVVAALAVATRGPRK